MSSKSKNDYTVSVSTMTYGEVALKSMAGEVDGGVLVYENPDIYDAEDSRLVNTLEQAPMNSQ